MKTRDKLIEATVKCLVEHGHAACSVKKIAAIAGVNHGLVHHHFGSKEGLFVETILATERRLHGEAGASAPAQEYAHYATLQFFQDGWAPRFIVEIFAMGAQMPAVADAVRQMMNRRVADVTRLMGHGDEAAARVLMCTVLGLTIYRQVDPDQDMAAVVHRALQAFMPATPRHPDRADDGSR